MELLCYWNLMDWLRPFIRKAISLVLGDCLRDLEQIDQMTGPRIIKSHLPLYLLNPEVLNTSKVCIHILSPYYLPILFIQSIQYSMNEKVVYVARNPKDVIVSYYHYHRLLEFHHYTGNLEAFADYFMTDRGTMIKDFIFVVANLIRSSLLAFFCVIYLDGKDSLQCSVLPSLVGRMEQTASSQFAFCLLRGS